MKSKDALGLYLHFPFCLRKCAYCDFLSAPADEDTKMRYAEALCKEIRAAGREAGHPRTDTVYLGGGTPSVMPPAALAAVMEEVKNSFDILPDAEITIEINPGTLTEALLAFVARTCDRVSLGAQSLNDDELRTLRRVHGAAEVGEAFAALRARGIKNISIDLMGALPGQTEASLLKTVEEIISLAPEHISLYRLQTEEGTPLFEAVRQGRLELPPEEEEQAMMAAAQKALCKAGYERYEISNYAKPGFASRHNLRYWQCRPYLGCGLGAASYNAAGYRYRNTRDLRQYLAADGRVADLREDLHCVSREEAMEEYCFLGLRMLGGISAADFAERFGQPIEEVFSEPIRKHGESGRLLFDGTVIRLSKETLAVSNQVLADFLLS